jgi:hypothetical protein
MPGPPKKGERHGRRLRAQRTRRNQDASKPACLERQDGCPRAGRVLQDARLRTDLFPAGSLLVVHAPPPRYGPLRELLYETDEPPDKQSSQLFASQNHRREGHEGDSSCVNTSTINRNNVFGPIVSLNRPPSNCWGIHPSPPPIQAEHVRPIRIETRDGPWRPYSDGVCAPPA